MLYWQIIVIDLWSTRVHILTGRHTRHCLLWCWLLCSWLCNENRCWITRIKQGKIITELLLTNHVLETELLIVLIISQLL